MCLSIVSAGTNFFKKKSFCWAVLDNSLKTISLVPSLKINNFSFHNGAAKLIFAGGLGARGGDGGLRSAVVIRWPPSSQLFHQHFVSNL